MSKFKSEVLPSGVLIRKIKDDDNNYVLTCQGQAIIVSKLDIARMDGIVYPTRSLSEKCCNVQQQTDVPDINVGDISRDKYTVVVREAARQMAKESYGHSFETSPTDVQELDIEYCMVYARIAVRLQAEAVREALKKYSAGGRYIESYLIERGLIPALENVNKFNKGDKVKFIEDGKNEQFGWIQDTTEIYFLVNEKEDLTGGGWYVKKHLVSLYDSPKNEQK